MTAFDQRLHSLLAAAARTFADRGFHATSMRDLSRASGMSLAGIYHYVASKEELLYLIQDRCFAQVIAGARIAIEAEPDPGSRLLAFIRHHVVFFAGHMAEMKVLSHEADELRGSMRAQLRRRKREYVALLMGLLESIPGNDIAPHTASYTLFGMMNWIYTWYHPTGPVSPEALGDEMGRLFLNGFARAGVATSTPGSAVPSTPLAVHHGG